MFTSLTADVPGKNHLRHWERVCRWLDAQPYRSVAYPYPTDPPISARLLRRMATFGLVRHRLSDCRWRLSPRWQAILRRLWAGLPADDIAATPADIATWDGAPFIADAGVDTLYVNLLADKLPARLLARLSAYKTQAQADDQTVETSWGVLGAPLSMYKAGVGTSGHGKGVSWGYLLRNAQVMLLLRKTPLNGIVGSARLSSEALWTLGARGALDGVRDGIKGLWADPDAAQALRWQLSQIHLCADVVGFAPTPADLGRVVTRARKKAVHLPSADDEALLWQAAIGEALADPWDVVAFPPEWDGVPLDDDEESSDADEEGDEQPADWEGAAVHLWGERASGFAFALGGDLSAVWYDKALEERLSGKRWMRQIHEQGGWDGVTRLTRVEARFRRGVLREVMPAGQHVGWFDDPWECLDHLGDLWALFAGLPEAADTAPDVTGRGWMRLVVPTGDDTNRWRWPTDDIWRIIQGATFQPAVPVALDRVKRVVHDLEQVDAELYGLFKLRSVLRGTPLTTALTLSQELRAFAERMEEVDAVRGRDYAGEVREKARMLGRPVPLRAMTVAGKGNRKHMAQG